MTMKNRFKPEINGRGHILAIAMLGGPGRKQRDFGYGPLFDVERKRNTRQMRRPKLPENEEK